MKDSERFINIRLRPEDNSYHARWVFEDRAGWGYFGTDLDECGSHVLATAKEVSGIHIRSVQEQGDVLEGLETVPKDDIEILVMVLNEKGEKFVVDQKKKSK
jgi:hypothetical protein